jgi:hypothetical protein
MISDPGFRFWSPEDEVTRQRVRPGTVRRIWPYLRLYRGPMVLLLGITAVDSAILVVSPLILRLIIDDGILRRQESVVVTLALTVAGLALVGARRGVREDVVFVVDRREPGAGAAGERLPAYPAAAAGVLHPDPDRVAGLPHGRRH